MKTFEQVLFLKTMPLFKYVKADELLSIPSVLEEQTVKPGEQIITKGDLGTTMYMIVKGKVKVHDGERLIKEMGEKEVFGELSALSPEKRIADVTAVEETLLLKISHGALYDLMEMQTGLAKGIIQFLCKRIRSIASDLEATSTK